MIVFTITNNESGRVFVSSSRNAPEERWEQLITQANEGSEGEIFDEIRSSDRSVFSVGDWGFGEDPKEIRQLMREAQQDLGATVINTGKMEVLPSAKRKKLSDRDAAKLLEEIERSLVGGILDDSIPTPSKTLDDEADQADEDTSDEDNAPTQSTSAATAPTSHDTKSSTITPTATTAVTDTIRKEAVASPEPSERTESLIERLARKVEREKAMAKKPAPKKAPVVAKKPTAPPKDALPTGKVSSKAKEQKIRDGIEKERENRAQARQAAERREAVEMSKVIASIELRRKTQKPVRVKAKAAAKKSDKTTEAKSTTLSKKVKAQPEELNSGPLFEAQCAITAEAEQEAQTTPTQIDTAPAQSNTVAEAITPQETIDKPALQILDRAMAIRSAKALNEIIRAKRSQQYQASRMAKATSKSKTAPKILSRDKSLGLSAQDQRLQQAIDREAAMHDAKKAAMGTSSSAEMAAVMARIDSRADTNSRTLRRR